MNIHCVYAGSMHLVKDEANRKDKCSYDTSGVSPALALQNAYTPHMHTRTQSQLSPGHFTVGVFGKYAILAFPSPQRMRSFHSSD